jgi:PAS domain S-box-containing protein
MNAGSGIRAVLDGALPSFSLEYPCHSPQRQRWFSMVVMPLGPDARDGVAITHTDISALKLAEQALAENEEHLRLFIRYAPVSLAMFDRDMRYLYASNHWLADYALGDRDLHGRSHYEIFPEIPEEWKIAAHRRGLAGEVLRSEGDRFERLDGSVQWVRWEIRPWHDATGTSAGSSSSARTSRQTRKPNAHWPRAKNVCLWYCTALRTASGTGTCSATQSSTRRAGGACSATPTTQAKPIRYCGAA